ncbi:uncharacterized protein LOC108136743 [Drosophila elegans]|uniref:uncharacterized protein LOC108136743 n=1 Tax=Drosophila elegans TaxID=30023 RepID=UPI0007E85019|nr:uncharacterized protein LOC108136743 [Drosophila elegans]
MALIGDEKVESVESISNLTQTDEITACVEKKLLQLRAENAERAAKVADMKKQMEVLLAEKYVAMSSVCHARKVPNVMTNIGDLFARNAAFLHTLNHLVIQKGGVAQAYANHCKNIIKTKKAHKQQSPLDETSLMPHHELKNHIEALKKEVLKIKSKSSLISEMLNKKRNLFNDIQTSITNDIRGLYHIEREAVEILDDLKSEMIISRRSA